MIDLAEIRPGDQVTLQDKDRNRVMGEVQGDLSHLWIEAFSTRLIFARANRNNRMTAHGKLQVIGHTASMF